jgi:hypothetical protein
MNDARLHVMGGVNVEYEVGKEQQAVVVSIS